MITVYARNGTKPHVGDESPVWCRNADQKVKPGEAIEVFGNFQQGRKCVALGHARLVFQNHFTMKVTALVNTDW